MAAATRPTYRADSKFDAFNSLLPYMLEEGGELKTLESLTPTAALPLEHLEVGMGTDRSVHTQDWSDFTDDIKNQVKSIGKIFSSPSEDESVLLATLRDCLEHIAGIVPALAIDIDRIFRAALAFGYWQIADYLITHCGASAKSRDICGRNPAFFAACHDTVRGVELLAAAWESDEELQGEAHCEAIDNKTPFQRAIDQRRPAVVQFFLDRGATYGPNDLDVLRNELQQRFATVAPDRLEDSPLFLLRALFTAMPAFLDLPIYMYWTTDAVTEHPDDAEERVTSYREFARMPSLSQVKHGPFVHIPWLNGLLGYALLRHVIPQHVLTDTHFKSIDHALDVYRWSFQPPPTVPGNPDLIYRMPQCTMHKYQNTLDIVFPCLVLQDIGSFQTCRGNTEAVTRDTKWSHVRQFFHVTRALDEAYYPSLTRETLDARNMQQVVTREWLAAVPERRKTPAQAPILVVSQFWFRAIGTMILSAYTLPGKLHNEPEAFLWDPTRYNKYSWLKEHISMRAWAHMLRSREVFIALMLQQRILHFGGPQADGTYQSPLDYFELGVIRVLSTVDDYMKENDMSENASETEKNIVNDIADIRDELAMIDDVLRQQETVIEKFMRILEEKEANDDATDKQSILRAKQDTESSRRTVADYRQRIVKIDKDAERVDKTVQDRLSLKRTFATINDARASMKEAKTSLLLAIAVIGFTVITILFAPLAFMTALLALNIDELQRHKRGSGDDAYYPSWFVFVTFGAAEIGTIILTVSFVYLCLRYKNALSTWAEQLSQNATTQDGSTTAINVKPNESNVVGSCPSDISFGDSTGSEGVKKEAKKSFSLSRRHPHSVDSTDAEERGEAPVDPASNIRRKTA